MFYLPSRCLHAATTALLLNAAIAHAQPQYPAKPIRLIVPFPPGGQTDIVARVLAPKLSEAFKQSIVIDNRAGGAGAIGTETVVKAAADGYTLLLVAAGYATNAALHALPYDPVNDVSPIVLVGASGFAIVAHPSVNVTNTRELIAYDKANPGKLNYGSGGSGTSAHLAAELFNQKAGTRLTHVPYKGAGPALIDVLGGQIQLNVGALPTMVPQVKTNRLRGIAVTTLKRANALPDIPTVAETIAGYEAVGWVAILGPKALPKAVVARWNQEINRVLQLPEVKDRLAGDGMEANGGSPEHLRAVLKQDVAKWRNVVRVAGIKAGG
jgi:tripartite-type tricarboxylate transporter receptor subunit TctC